MQSEFSFLKEAKDFVYRIQRRLLTRPHEHEFRALKFIPDDLPGSYVDIGANQGQSIESIKKVKPKARVYSYEANPLLAEKLQKRYQKRDDIRVFAFGLGDEPKKMTLFVPVYKGFVYDGDSSLDPQMASALLTPERLYWFNPKQVELREVGCAIERLDEQNLDPVFIKMDVQGYESLVARGGIETFKRCEPVLMVERVYDHTELMSILDTLGYEEYLFDEHGFYPGSAPHALNQILMTPRRAAEVRRSAAASA